MGEVDGERVRDHSTWKGHSGRSTTRLYWETAPVESDKSYALQRGQALSHLLAQALSMPISAGPCLPPATLFGQRHCPRRQPAGTALVDPHG